MGLVAVEGFPHGGVVDFGIMARHIGAGVADQLLHDVLGDAGVYQAGPERVAQLVGGDGHGAAIFVMEVYAPLPGPQLAPEGMVVKRAARHLWCGAGRGIAKGCQLANAFL